MKNSFLIAIILGLFFVSCKKKEPCNIEGCTLTSCDVLPSTREDALILCQTCEDSGYSDSGIILSFKSQFEDPIIQKYSDSIRASLAFIGDQWSADANQFYRIVLQNYCTGNIDTCYTVANGSMQTADRYISDQSIFWRFEAIAADTVSTQINAYTITYPNENTGW